MIPQKFDYINDRRSEDVELVFDLQDGGKWVVSFVATVPHYCESKKIFGDLFDCPLAAIDHESIPVARGSDREAEIVKYLEKSGELNNAPDACAQLSPPDMHGSSTAISFWIDQEVTRLQYAVTVLSKEAERRQKLGTSK